MSFRGWFLRVKWPNQQCYQWDIVILLLLHNERSFCYLSDAISKPSHLAGSTHSMFEVFCINALYKFTVSLLLFGFCLSGLFSRITPGPARYTKANLWNFFQAARCPSCSPANGIRARTVNRMTIKIMVVSPEYWWKCCVLQRKLCSLYLWQLTSCRLKNSVAIWVV